MKVFLLILVCPLLFGCFTYIRCDEINVDAQGNAAWRSNAGRGTNITNQVEGGMETKMSPR